jgi:type I pantothenate kinase
VRADETMPTDTRAAPGLESLADLLRARRRVSAGVLIVGVTGAVAAGKSTLSATLAAALEADGLSVEIVATDGFLLPNAALEARGIAGRKGFPESYDLGALQAALAGVRTGPVVVPGYSHSRYDVDPSLARTLNPPDVLFVEGLSLQSGAAALGLDLLIYLDADEADLESWFTERLLGLWREAEHDPTSFYARFRHFTEPEARAFAGQVWRMINLPNLREHIVQGRDVADIVVRKGADHRILDLTVR